MALVVRPYAAATDEGWATAFLSRHLGGRSQARRGELIDVLGSRLGLVAERDGRPTGLLTYRPEVDREAVELSAIATDPVGAGTGSALIAALDAAVRAMGRQAIRVVTTNDNVDSLRFYQRHGYVLCELRPGAVDESRAVLKPAIPRIGQHGIPMRDELELEHRL